MQKGGRTSPQSVRAAENAAKAFDLRLAGYSYTEIGKKIGVSDTAAYFYVSKTLAAKRESLTEKKADLVELEVSRLDKYIKVLEQKIDNGEEKSIEVCMKAMERRAKLLGLDLPDQHEVKQSVSFDDIPIEELKKMIENVRATQQT